MRRFGATPRHAACKALRRSSSVASDSLTFVYPRRPQVPGTGSNTSDSANVRNSCSSGVSLTTPYSSSGQPRVANTLPRTLKSGCFPCACSIASGNCNARRRKSSGVIACSCRGSKRSLGDVLPREPVRPEWRVSDHVALWNAAPRNGPLRVKPRSSCSFMKVSLRRLSGPSFFVREVSA